MSSTLPPVEEADSPLPGARRTLAFTPTQADMLHAEKPQLGKAEKLYVQPLSRKRSSRRSGRRKSYGGPAAEEMEDAPIGLTLSNSILSRTLRRKTLSAAVNNVEWSRSVGGGSIAQKLRLRERVITFRVLHILFTIAVFQHFFYNKYNEKLLAVPKAATNYKWKLLVPPIEFGMMHAMLFQLALIPLTVSRSLLAWVATKTSALPLEHIMTLHIHIGYAFCIVLTLSTILFFTFFGKLCQDYKEGTEAVDMCAKFRTEIMATGLALFGLTLCIFATSYFRGRLKFEVFYSVHVIFVGVMYFGALIHTLDDEFRKESKVGKARSQTFKWVIGSLAVFLADRSWRYLTQESEIPVIKAFCHADGGSVTIHLLKPWWFSFLPGQNVQLQLPAIDWIWHPFSIGSSPESNVLTVIIEVSPKKGQWTNTVAEMVRAGTLTKMNIRGPFGNPVGPSKNSPEAANIIAVGSGTGIVPMISLLKSRAEALSELSAAGLTRTQNTLAQRQLAANQAWCLGANVSTATNERVRHCQLLYRSARLEAFSRGEKPMPAFLKKATASAGSRKPLIMALLTILWVCVEAASTSAVLSWSNLGSAASMTPGMVGFLEYSTMMLIVPYMMVVVAWIFCRSRAEQGPLIYIHVLAVILMAGLVRYFIVYHKYRDLAGTEQTALVLFSMWRVASAWSSRSNESYNAYGVASSNPVESFRFIWATRSAELVIGVLQDLERTFRDLEKSVNNNGSTNVVGTEAFPQLQLQVFCTDTNPEHVAALKKWLKGTRFESLVMFERPELGKELASSMRRQVTAPSFMNRLPGEKKTCAVTFCGSPVVSDALFRAVRRCGQLATVAGAADFEYTFRTESYSNMPKPRSSEAAGIVGESVIAGPKCARPTKTEKNMLKAEQWITMRESLAPSSPEKIFWDASTSKATKSDAPPDYE